MTNQATKTKQYSIAKLSELLDRSPAQVKAYKRVLLEAFAANTQLVAFSNGSLNAEGLTQLKTIKTLFSTGDQGGYCESVWSEQPELRPQSVGAISTELETVTAEPNAGGAMPASITVIEGNHRSTLEQIDLNSDFSLGHLRTELTTVESYADPLAMARQLIQQNNALATAMNADLQQQQQRLDATTQAVAMVEQSNYQLMLKAQQYQIDSRVQSAMLSQQTTQLQQKIAIQQSLGKPAGSSSVESQQ